MMSKVMYASAAAALLVSGVSANSRSLKEAESYTIASASAGASGSSYAEPGYAETYTYTSTFADGYDVNSFAVADSSASADDWWGLAEADSYSKSETDIAEGYLSVEAYAFDDAHVYGDAVASAVADADADGTVTIHKIKKHWEPEPEPEPEPTPEPCDGWWCHMSSRGSYRG